MNLCRHEGPSSGEWLVGSRPNWRSNQKSDCWPLKADLRSANPNEEAESGKLELPGRRLREGNTYSRYSIPKPLLHPISMKDFDFRDIKCTLLLQHEVSGLGIVTLLGMHLKVQSLGNAGEILESPYSVGG